MSENPIVIVGASLAGLRAAKAMRTRGEEGEIVVVGDEDRLPYTRPPLSKGVLQGTEEPESTDLGGADLDVSWRLGERASAVDPVAHEVALEGGSKIPYRRLLVATGSRPRQWKGPGRDLDGLFTLRTIEDSLALKERFAERPRVVTVGAGFIGCEVAATARALGLDVTMVDIAGRPLPAFGDQVGDWLAQWHRWHGVKLRLGTGVEAIEGAGQVEAVRLADGTKVDADVVVVALGAVPETGLLEESGLELTSGVRCDATLTSVSDPDILAAGDVAAWPHPLAPSELQRVEHWSNAAEGGRLAGRNLLLEPHEREAHAALPTMWTDQHGLRIQVAGLPARADRTHTLEAEPDGHRRVTVCSRDGRICAAVAVAAPRRLGWYREHVKSGTSVEQVVAALESEAEALGPPVEAVWA
ncbi:MAG: NAD(P)/FAD-dependent oxidoreductase [Solirubrobacterales bacterium]|nr:NAD(P)/FAD-dependent oxidoreductase [Solirubrobacterales bacterium]